MNDTDIWAEIGPALGEAYADALAAEPWFPDSPYLRITELRAILRPLLERPFPPSSEYHLPCVFCHEVEVHTPDCPVRRKDELLGR